MDRVYTHAVQVAPARANHAIWGADPCAISTVADARLPGQSNEAGFRGLRDSVTGAHLLIWPHYAVRIGDREFAPGADTRLVAWIDGPRAPGSGRYLAWCLCGEPAGGQLAEV